MSEKLMILLQDMKSMECPGHTDSTVDYKEGWYAAIKCIETYLEENM